MVTDSSSGKSFCRLSRTGLAASIWLVPPNNRSADMVHNDCLRSSRGVGDPQNFRSPETCGQPLLMYIRSAAEPNSARGARERAGALLAAARALLAAIRCDGDRKQGRSPAGAVQASDGASANPPPSSNRRGTFLFLRCFASCRSPQAASARHITSEAKRSLPRHESLLRSRTRSPRSITTTQRRAYQARASTSCYHRSRTSLVAPL